MGRKKRIQSPMKNGIGEVFVGRSRSTRKPKKSSGDGKTTNKSKSKGKSRSKAPEKVVDVVEASQDPQEFQSFQENVNNGATSTAELSQLEPIPGPSKAVTNNVQVQEVKKTDKWLCYFCNQPAHFFKLGELCGPYYVFKGMPKEEEIWTHIDCSVFAHNLILVGETLFHLKEVVELAKCTQCCYCNELRATVICRNKQCIKVAHYPCAVRNKWNLKCDKEDYRVFCDTHDSVDVCRMSGDR